MNSVKITQTLKQAMIDYLMTTFDANKDGKEPELARMIRESYEYPRALFTGPFLELIYPYSKVISLQDLCDQNVLSTKILDLSCFNLPKPEPIPLHAPLYSHQMKAIQKLTVDNHSIVISSGTGSGKTECFSIPIVNDLLKDDAPGVRALLVYPLNALVNDQMERLRVLLKGTSITFGRFTSELPNQARRTDIHMPNEVISRDEIRSGEKIPQILITNYAMLEYLLFRPEDSMLFTNGLWKFLVLDEAHTYTGAQGIEVAMLIRRLKHRLGKTPGEMLCVATSATLVNDNPSAAADFAQKLFCENLVDDDVIFGDEDRQHFGISNQSSAPIPPEAYLHPDFDDMLVEMRKESSDKATANGQRPDVEKVALWLNEIGIIDTSALSNVEIFSNDMPGFLFNVLANNDKLLQLRNWMVTQSKPVLFDEAASYLFPNFSVQDQAKALYRLIEIGALAKPAENQLPLLPAKYHLFVRPPQGTWACLNPDCSGKDHALNTKWSRIYSNPINFCESCGAQVYPLHLCRECGQVYVASHYQPQTNTYMPAIDQLGEGVDKRYFTWREIEENIVLADQEEPDEEDELAEGEKHSTHSKFIQQEIILCLTCGKPINTCTCGKRMSSIPLLEVAEKLIKNNRKGKPQEAIKPLSDLHECPRCHSKAKKATEVVTPAKVHGTGPLANLTYELYRELPAANDPSKKSLPGEGRKLLTFYDSRQGAARFAAFLQDVSNKQNYRHIIPLAIDQCLQPDDWGNCSSPNLYKLGSKSAEIAWQKGIIQNDTESTLSKGEETTLLNRDKKSEAAIWMSRIILGEFTTRRRSRQSLESMGLVGVSYFHHDEQPDLESLSQTIGLSIDQTSSLVGYLLDNLRFEKVIKLPPEITPDDPEFGTNIGNPRIIRQGMTRRGEVRWIGKTPRHNRIKYIKLVLEQYNLDSSEDNIVKVLTEIWDWMINDTAELFEGTPEKGYQLNPSHIYFDTHQNWCRCKRCQRLNYRGTLLPCPYPNCGGELEAVDINIAQNDNYYYDLFNRPLVPIRVEEHTAQLDPEKGKKYQDAFKKGYINALSCSTTFEMGIDLGDLQAVAMSNVPPSVSNYRQRAGRAGRRTSGTAYILTWASDRPHDQAYYDAPIEIISGRVAVPSIILENEYILQRHVNSLLLSQFLRYRRLQGVEIEKLTFSGDFFDINLSEKPHFAFIQKWMREESAEIKKQLTEYSRLVPDNMKMQVLAGAERLLTDLKKLDEENYQPITNYYLMQIHQILDKLRDTSMPLNLRKELQRKEEYFNILLDRMRGSNVSKRGYLIEYLSNNGVLPSYSFPLNTVELTLPKYERDNAHLRLERDLRQAIKEYAPGSEIVADKRIWRSERPLFWKDTPIMMEYRICENCHHLEISAGAGLTLPADKSYCSVCNEPFGRKSKIRKFVEPDGFIADKNSGKAAKQYVNIEPNQMRSALIPEHNLDEEEYNAFIRLSYNQEGKLLYVNEGKYGNGFEFSTQAFSFIDEGKQKERLSLGHIQKTNTLHIRFVGHEYIRETRPDDHSFWLSLLYAIIHGACHCLQIERNDIDGVLFPRSISGKWEQTIVLYDNVPGGAGHVRSIRENLLSVLEEARRVLNCNDCAPDTSCYHCLRDYNNQYFHQILVREKPAKFLDTLIASLKPLAIDVPGAVRVVSSDLKSWLYEKLRYARQSASVAITKLEMGHPMGDSRTWLDTLSDLLNKGCELNIYLQELPKHTPEGYSLSEHLRILIARGLKVWKIPTLPEWQMIIDSEYSEPRIIGSNVQQYPIILHDEIGAKNLITSTNTEAVKRAVEALNSIQKLPISASDLQPPKHTKVINIKKTSGAGLRESDFFADFFSKPIKTLNVNDPYLHNHERIVNRLGAYIDMASQQDTLEKVVVWTKRDADPATQDRAIRELERKYSFSIKFIFDPEHDRYIDVTRVNGERARIFIGRGLDFIQKDGSLAPTYIVIQDPY